MLVAESISTGWNNPDLQNLPQRSKMSHSFQLVPNSKQAKANQRSGEVELDSSSARYQPDGSVLQGHTSSNEEISQLVPESIQIHLKLKKVKNYGGDDDP